MRSSMMRWGSRMGHITWLSGALMVTMATNDDGGCFGELPDDGAEAECQVASNCEGRAHITCVGQWACDEGVCTWNCAVIPPECQRDADCKEGELCRDDGVCVPKPPPPPTGCFSSEECKEGQHCSIDDGVCHTPPGCGAGPDCPDVCYGECVNDEPTSCGANGECPDGYYCGCAPWADAAGEADVMCRLVCLPKDDGRCDADWECAAGQACVNGVCVEQTKGCWSDSECGTGFYCDFSDPSWCMFAGADGGAMPPPPPDGEEDRPAPACPGQCLPSAAVCDDGTMCPPGHHCETTCIGVCPACDDPSGNCDTECYEECKSVCVPDWNQGCTSDEQCGEGYYCGGCGEVPMPNGIMICERQCLPKEPAICHYDYECGPNRRCDLIACEGAGVPECDPSSGEACEEKRPVPVDPACWGYCVDNNVECKTDMDCKDGYYCQIDWCTDGSADFVPGTCGGHCELKQPTGECDDDSDCVDAAGNQGWCNLACAVPYYDADGNGVPDCDPADATCDMIPVCKGWCEWAPPTCDPTTDSCPEGTHCESACGAGGFVPGGLIYCPWQCVPDQKKCESDCDCGFGEVCKEYACVAAEAFQCDENWQCPEGYECGCGWSPGFGIACFPQCHPTRPQCCSNADCGDGSQCVDNMCQPWYCWDGACPDGYVCESQCPYPTPANGLIACPSLCVPAPTKCETDCDCPQWEACINNQCQVADRLNECYPTGCQDDSMCEPSQQCMIACPACIPGGVCPPCIGSCVDRPECKSDADCWDGQVCHKDAVCPECVNADPPCLAPCTISDVGYCAPPEPTGCTSDDQCATGEKCDLLCPPCACPVNPDGTWGPCPWCECRGTCVAAEPPPGECYVGGCSGQVCSDRKDVITTCEARPYYACYGKTTCERQADGTCGWTETDAFYQCMMDMGGFSNTP